MDLDGLWQMARSLADRLPAEWHLAALWPQVALLVVSVLIGLYGEKLIRLVVLGLFVLLGVMVGQHAAAWLALPPAPTIILAGSLAGIGVVLFYRWMLALALALVIAGACAAGYVSASLDRTELLEVLSEAARSASESPAAPSEPPAGPAWAADTQRLWDFAERLRPPIGAVVAKPEGLKEMLLVMLAGAGAGMLAGLVLGRLAAVLLSSVLGAAGVLLAVVNLLGLYQPAWAEPLSDYPQYVLIACGLLALIFAFRQQAHRPVAVAAPPGEVAGGKNKS